jgi:hypothetical protein
MHVPKKGAGVENFPHHPTRGAPQSAGDNFSCAVIPHNSDAIRQAQENDSGTHGARINTGISLGMPPLVTLGVLACIAFNSLNGPGGRCLKATLH